MTLRPIERDARVAPMDATANTPPLVAFLALSDCQLLDVAGPFDLFAAARHDDGAPAYRCVLVSSEGDRVATEAGLALEAGADDCIYEKDVATILGDPTEFLSTKEALEGAGLTFLSAETGYVPQNTIEIASKDDAAKIMKLIGFLEDNEDVQNGYANYNIPDEWLEELSA